MIELKANAKKSGTKYHVESEVAMEGKGEAIVCELCSLLNDLEKDALELFHDALETFLRQRGC